MKRYTEKTHKLIAIKLWVEKCPGFDKADIAYIDKEIAKLSCRSLLAVIKLIKGVFTYGYNKGKEDRVKDETGLEINLSHPDVIVRIGHLTGIRGGKGAA